ncbi:MAG TPA: dihydrofolate reductase family protein [Longimicrobiales bacterium]|nr:dihydrofolate reductase family protein [Longimicrobiales bacterium]
MRHVTYYAQMGLDGRIAGPDGRFDWLPGEEAPGALKGLLASVDTVLMGEATYEFLAGNGFAGFPGKTTIVFSRTLDPEVHRDVWIVGSHPAPLVGDLRRGPGRDIWVVGDGVVFPHLLEAGLVDRLVIGIHPVLVGAGAPLLPEMDVRTSLRLEHVERHETGLVTLSYAVVARTLVAPWTRTWGAVAAHPTVEE